MPKSGPTPRRKHNGQQRPRDGELVRYYVARQTVRRERYEGEAKLRTTLLLAEDDPDDRLLVKDALEEGRWAVDLRLVENGEELMDYLCRRGKYTDPDDSPYPNLILLDLKMPRKSGHQALQEIKADPELRLIPVVVLTTSKAEEDIVRSYDLGANSFIVKPTSFEALIETMKNLQSYWFGLVMRPPGRTGSPRCTT